MSVDDFSLIIHGTKTKPIEYENFIETNSINVSLLSIYESYQLNSCMSAFLTIGYYKIILIFILIFIYL